MPDSTRSTAPNRPERGADRNRRALATDDALDPVLPSLDDGVTLLDVDGRGVPVVQSLALDHLLTESGPAFWVDTAGCARTTTLARVAPSWRLLERVQVARGFTPYQHHAAVSDVPDAVATTTEARASDGTDPALLVAPAVDGRYRDADDLPREHARQLLARTLARLRRYATAYDVPVLLTRTGSVRNEADGDALADATGDAFGDVVANAVDHRLRCEQTPQGPRFVGDDETETLVYPQPDGTLQTTFAYWRTVLSRRASAAGVASTDAPTAGSGPGASSAAVADGTDAFATTAPGRRLHAAHERVCSPWHHDR